MQNKAATEQTLEYMSYLPTLISSPSMMPSEIPTKIRVRGLNMGGKVGPCIEIAHVIKQNVAAVASAPCSTQG